MCSSVILIEENDTLPSKHNTMNWYSNVYLILVVLSAECMTSFSTISQCGWFPNRQAHRTVCRSEAEQTIHLLPGKYEPCFSPLLCQSRAFQVLVPRLRCRSQREERATSRPTTAWDAAWRTWSRCANATEWPKCRCRGTSPFRRQRRNICPRLSPTTVPFLHCLSCSIGCGLDRLNWDRVSEILEQVFSGSDISITVYSLPERAETKVMNENRRR